MSHVMSSRQASSPLMLPPSMMGRRVYGVESRPGGSAWGTVCALCSRRREVSLCHLADTHSFMGFPEPPSGLCTVQHNERGDGGGRETWEIREGGGEVFSWGVWMEWVEGKLFAGLHFKLFLEAAHYNHSLICLGLGALLIGRGTSHQWPSEPASLNFSLMKLSDVKGPENYISHERLLCLCVYFPLIREIIRRIQTLHEKICIWTYLVGY